MNVTKSIWCNSVIPSLSLFSLEIETYLRMVGIALFYFMSMRNALADFLRNDKEYANIRVCCKNDLRKFKSAFFVRTSEPFVASLRLLREGSENAFYNLKRTNFARKRYGECIGNMSFQSCPDSLVVEHQFYWGCLATTFR